MSKKPDRSKRKPAPKTSFPTWSWILLTVVLVAAVIAFVNMQNNKPASTGLGAEVSVEQAAQLREEGAFILDVREPSEWVEFHIPGSTLIPLGELPNRLSEIPTDQQIVVVCRSGNRSATGRDILLNAGFGEVTSMAGGVTRWQSQGLPIATGE